MKTKRNIKKKNAGEEPYVKKYEYWLGVVGDYIEAKREAQGMTQEDLKVRQTASSLENKQTNFTFKILMRTLEEIDGDISEMFQSHVPKSLHGEHQALHEMLQRVLATGNVQADFLVRRTITSAFDDFVLKKKSNKS